MATCSAVISRALRLARIVGIGDEPTASELAEGMIVLSSFYNRIAETALRAEEVWYVEDDVLADENQRIYSTGVVTLPTTIEDGETRRPKDLAAIQYNENGDEDDWQTWISDRGDWVRIDDLSSNDEAPLSRRNQEGLSALIAVELAGTFGREAGAETVAKARRFQSMLQPVDDTPNEYY